MDAKKETRATIENLMSVSSFMEEFKQNNFDNYDKCLNTLVEMTIRQIDFINSLEFEMETSDKKEIDLPKFVVKRKA